MAILGKKFGRKTRKLAKKFDQKVHKLGQKTNNVLDKVENANEKIIKHSGKALHVADKVLKTGDKILHVANEAGLKNVPVVGGVSELAETGLHQGHKGVHKLSKARDKYANVSRNAIKKGRNAGNALEKHNTRKELAKMARDEAGDSFK